MTRPPDGRQLILLADDDADTVAAYEVLFGRRGYAVETAADGAEALAKAIDVRPDIIVLDMGLPRLDGLQVLRALRSEPTTRRMPVIVLTGRASTTEVDEAQKAGGNVVLTKPCEPDELCRAVETLLRSAPILAPKPPSRGGPGEGGPRIAKPR
jgi:two-component system KDP operon response regulator KdpE